MTGFGFLSIFSLFRSASWWRSSGLCCCSVAWCGCGTPTHCTNNMNVRNCSSSECSLLASCESEWKKASYVNRFLRSLPQQSHALSRHPSLAPRHLLQCQQPLLQISNQRRGFGSRLQLSQLGVSLTISAPTASHEDKLSFKYANHCFGMFQAG